MLNWHQFKCKLFPNSTKKVHNLHHSRKFMQIRCQKGSALKCTNVWLELMKNGFSHLLKKGRVRANLEGEWFKKKDSTLEEH